MIYFDNAATTKPHKTIIELYQKLNNEYWFNESSTHHLGITSKTLLDKANKAIINTLHLKNKKVIFTSSASEANNLAIYGICKPYYHQGKHIITTQIEHPSILNCFKDLETKGFKVTYLKVNQDGIIDLDELKQVLTKDTILVSIMWVNNIVGSIQPMQDIIDILKNYPRVKFHSDLVQGLTKLIPSFNLDDLDMLTFTAHKIHGLKGTAALVVNDKISLDSLIKGGHQQNNLRAGTVDVPGAVCLAKALEIANDKTIEHYQYVNNLHQYLKKKLKKFSFIIINQNETSYSPYVLNFSLNKLKGETFMHYMEASSIYLGYGSACNAKTAALEPTLIAIYNDESRAINAVRISLSEENTKEEIDIFINALKKLEEEGIA